MNETANNESGRDGMESVNQYNAEEYSDNYAVFFSDGGFIGCEHNETEARMIADWITGHKGRKCIVKRNSRESVKAAKVIRGSSIAATFKGREFAIDEMQQLANMGMWK